MAEATTGVDERDRWFLGTHLRIVADAATTGGQLTVMEQRARRGFSPPLHLHRREDTAMLVLEGRLTVQRGDEILPVGPGELVWLPRDVPHSFRVDSDEVHLYELATPAGIEGFHLEASVPAGGPGLPPPGPIDPALVPAVVGDYGAEIVGPPMA